MVALKGAQFLMSEVTQYVNLRTVRQLIWKARALSTDDEPAKQRMPAKT